MRAIKGLPGYGLTYGDGEGLVGVAKHFVDEEEHGNVELDAEALANVGYAVESFRILTAEVYRHHVAMGLDTLLDECFLPRYVLNHPVDAPAAEPSRKHDDVVVAFEDGFHHAWKVPALLSRLVDGDEQGLHAVEVHQKVVDEIFDAPVEMVAKEGTKGNAVLPAEGVIADEGVKAAIVRVGQILPTYHLKGDINELQ